MPKVLFINGFSFFFFSNEGFEPPHIHISKDHAEAKYWLVPEVLLDYSDGFNVRELRFINEIVIKNHEFFLGKWNEYFSGKKS